MYQKCVDSMFDLVKPLNVLRHEARFDFGRICVVYNA